MHTHLALTAPLRAAARPTATALLALSAIACGADDAPATATNTVPTLAVSAPVGDGAVTSEKFWVAFTVSNFTLAAPGTCVGAASCGHVAVLIDGTNCNADGVPYNAASAVSPFLADLGLCDTVDGTHQVTIALQHDDGAPVMNGDAAVSVDQPVSFSTVPSLTITSPAPGATVDLAADFTVPIGLATTHFDLAEPGTCDGEAACGHVHLLVDGAACNDAHTPYNNAGGSDQILAKLALCTDVEGTHSAVVELHHDDHSPVTGARGATVTAMLTFTVTSSRPRILIVSPAAGALVAPSGPDQGVPVAFKVAGFELAEAGTCAGVATCGHAHLLVDGSTCNTAGRPYNNDGEASPIDALLSKCHTELGPHTVSIELRHDDHSALEEEGATVHASVDFIAQ